MRQKNPLPKNWASIRKKVLERDNYTCQLNYGRCTQKATEVDHIIPRNPQGKQKSFEVSKSYIEYQGNNRMDNLRAVCKNCHVDRNRSTGLGSNKWY